MIRDDEPFNTVLSADILYTANGSAGVAAYSPTNNDHYQQLDDQGADLKAVLQKTTQSSLLGIPATATAGVITTRAAAEAFFVAGTNRAMFRFTLINHLCRDMDAVLDISRPPDRIRQDVSRSPGGDSRIFLNNCIGCHSGMDPMAQSFAYYNYDATTLMQELYSAPQVQAKYSINTDNFKPGYVTRMITGTTTGGRVRTRSSAGIRSFRVAGTAPSRWARNSRRAMRSPSVRSRRLSRLFASARPQCRRSREGRRSDRRVQGGRLQDEAGVRRHRRLLHGRLRERTTMNRAKYLLLPAALLLALLSACSGVRQRSRTCHAAPTVADYTGPAPANADVQAFKLNLWENIKAGNRCGGCHNATMQSPHFARNDDVNLAYQDANTVVSLTQPDQSRMVQKVGGGHNCWLASNSACADILTTWIRNWAGSVAGGGTQIQLTAPADVTVGSSKSFPSDSSAFASTIYPITRQYCSRCHASGAATPQSPFHADADVNVAYADGAGEDQPRQSRSVAPGARLRDEFHNCWSDCAANAQTMLDAVNAFVGPLPVQQVDPALVVSKALTLYDGTVASGGNRYDTNVIALYQFKTGTGTTAYDTSGVDPAANLTLSAPSPGSAAGV